MVGRPRPILAGRWGGWWRMEVISSIVGIRMSIPPAFPGLLSVFLPVMEFEIFICVPTDRQLCLPNGRRVVRRGKNNLQFEMTACIRDGRSGDLLGRFYRERSRFRCLQRGIVQPRRWTPRVLLMSPQVSLRRGEGAILGRLDLDKRSGSVRRAGQECRPHRCVPRYP